MVPLTFYAWAVSARKPAKKAFAENPQTLGEHIRKKRIQSGLLQRELAVLFNVIEDSITHWETGYAEPQVQHYPAIISFLGYYPFTHETETLGGKLKQYRYCNGYSYEALGPLWGVNPSTVRSWEIGTHRPGVAMQQSILLLWSQLEIPETAIPLTT